MSSVLHWTELNMKMDEVIKEMMAEHEKRWLEKQSMTRDNVFTTPKSPRSFNWLPYSN